LSLDDDYDDEMVDPKEFLALQSERSQNIARGLELVSRLPRAPDGLVNMGKGRERDIMKTKLDEDAGAELKDEYDDPRLMGKHVVGGSITYQDVDSR
jgi:hypothetical protein